MHVHANVESSGENKRTRWREWVRETVETFKKLLMDTRGGEEWAVEELHLECVKSYAPKIHHLVLDIKCCPKKLS